MSRSTKDLFIFRLHGHANHAKKDLVTESGDSKKGNCVLKCGQVYNFGEQKIHISNLHM